MDKEVFFGLFVCLLLATGTSACSLQDHFQCASLIDKMENRDTIVNNRTCRALDEAIHCVKDLWKDCSYDCSKEYTDYSYNSDYKCMIHVLFFTGPMDKNLKMNEHPCVVLKNLEDCVDSCLKEPGDEILIHLDQPGLNFTDGEFKILQERRACAHGAIERYTRKFETIQSWQLDVVKCTEIKVSWLYFLEDLSAKSSRKRCVGSQVQQMVVDVVGAGMGRYVNYCDDKVMTQHIDSALSPKPGTLPGQKCSLENHFKCASIIGELESRNTIENNSTCLVLNESIDCLKNLWQECGYDCSKQYQDFSHDVKYSCEVNVQVLNGPMGFSMRMDEHPCVVLENLEDCVDSCQDNTSIPGSAPTNLNIIRFTEEFFAKLEDRRKCSDAAVDKYTRKYKSYLIPDASLVSCTEIKVSRDYFLDDLIMRPETRNCDGSEVQHMAVDVIGAGLNRYLKYCDDNGRKKSGTPPEPECQGDTCQASSLSCSIVAILFVVIGYILDN